MEEDSIRIGVLATLIGPYAGMGEDGVRGATLALEEFGEHVAGKPITLVKEGTNATPDSAEIMADVLLKKHAVDFIVGPLSGDEGIAIREYAKTRLDKTFINGAGGSQDMTLRDPAPNFFSFITNAVQHSSGLAAYLYEVKGYRRIATLGEDYSYPHGQIGGLNLEFCRMGGKIVQKFWVALGTQDFTPVIGTLPDDIDALYVVLAGMDAVNFLRQYVGSSMTKPLVGGSAMVDQTSLKLLKSVTERLIGLVSSGPVAEDNPEPYWQTFVNDYRARFPRGLGSPSLFAFAYYINTKAALLALEQVSGDLSNGQARFKAALTSLEFIAPIGRVRLDHNRQVIANVYISEIVQRPDGSIHNNLVRIVPDVDNTLGIPETEYLKIGSMNRNNPSLCP